MAEPEVEVEKTEPEVKEEPPPPLLLEMPTDFTRKGA